MDLYMFNYRNYNILQNKSGLLSLLPQPKNGVKLTTKSLIPDAVKQKATVSTTKKTTVAPAPVTPTPVVAKSVKNLAADYSDDDDDSDNDEATDFFSINRKHEISTEDAPIDIDTPPPLKQAKIDLNDVTSHSYFEDTVENNTEAGTEGNGVGYNEYSETSGDVELDEEAVSNFISISLVNLYQIKNKLNIKLN